MLLELLDSRFKVNPWHGKSVIGSRCELANCADASPVLPKILFWTKGGASSIVSFEKCFAFNASATMNRERGGKKSYLNENIIFIFLMNVFAH
ncbi:TPA: hypothetical protein MYN45_002877 [Klebsiella variicola subsp. variicola]|uniref:hypothetical protein n=1 Tax=Klebsiella variicola TaxID=244366 RepID=UPI0010342207|nr:hypothetical protein [Klebsiella variicola]HCB0505477.1 hypothetical protein [Klebsiella variicola subsp. variicola]